MVLLGRLNADGVSFMTTEPLRKESASSEALQLTSRGHFSRSGDAAARGGAELRTEVALDGGACNGPPHRRVT